MPSEAQIDAATNESLDTTKRTTTRREIYYTPETALQIIEPYIKDYKTIWDPAAELEFFPIRDYFEKKGHRVIITDITMGVEYDFFKYRTKKRFDIIVTTPPYSLRKAFVMRACELKKAFAMFVPINILESHYIRDLLKKYKMSLIFPPKLITFSSPEDSKSIKNIPYCIWMVGGVEGLPELVWL